MNSVLTDNIRLTATQSKFALGFNDLGNQDIAPPYGHTDGILAATTRRAPSASSPSLVDRHLAAKTLGEI